MKHKDLHKTDKGNMVKKNHITLCITVLAVFSLSFSTYYTGSVKASESTTVSIFPVKTFTELLQKIDGLGNPQNTLVVMDDDDTLTMFYCPEPPNTYTCQYLGGPAWFSWQNTLLTSTNPHDKQYKVAKTFDELLNISALLLAINNMVYTESDVPTVLLSLQKSGANFLVLTARGSNNVSATESQFSYLKVPGKEEFLDFISKNALKGKHSDISSIASPFLFPSEVCKLNHPLTYRNGILYASGQNKGLILKCFFGVTKSSNIKNIVFIDDTEKNVEDVYKSFKDHANYNVIALHYTALENHKKALTKGNNAKILQKNAKERWEAIKKTLTKELLKPANLQ